MKKLLTPLFYLFMVIGLFLFYSNYSKTIPFSFYDEFWWVSDSYLAEYYFKSDFGNDVWKSEDAIHQPMLTRLVFAASLYPKYIDAKAEISDDRTKTEYTYSRFLISAGLIYSQGNNNANSEYVINSYYKYKPVEHSFVGFESDFIDRYGESVSQPLALIKWVRKLNSLLLAGSVLVLFIFIKKYKRAIFSVFTTLLFGVNNLILQSALRAHSEALFIFLFVFTIHFIVDYFHKPSTLRLFAMSVFVGLTVSTKLTGLILYSIVIVCLVVLSGLNKRRNRLWTVIKKSIITGLIIFGVFIVVNPYTYSGPITKSYQMFKYRTNLMTQQQNYFGDASLPTLHQRFSAISTALFSHTNPLSGILLSVFLIGLYAGTAKRYIKNIFETIMFVSFIITTLVIFTYFKLNWSRYLVPLIPFTVYYEVVGLWYVLNLVRSRLWIQK